MKRLTSGPTWAQMSDLIIKLIQTEKVPAISEREVADKVLVKSAVEPDKDVPPGVEAPLLRPPFFAARFVDELDRDRIREIFESVRLAFGRARSGSFHGSLVLYNPVSGSGVGALLTNSCSGRKAWATKSLDESLSRS